MICQSCYWIASCIKADYKDFPRCPRCGTDIVNIPPISDLTFFKYDVSDDEGLDLLEEVEIQVRHFHSRISGYWSTRFLMCLNSYEDKLVSPRLGPLFKTSIGLGDENAVPCRGTFIVK